MSAFCYALDLHLAESLRLAQHGVPQLCLLHTCLACGCAMGTHAGAMAMLASGSTPSPSHMGQEGQACCECSPPAPAFSPMKERVGRNKTVLEAACSVRVPQGTSVCVQNGALGLGVREVTELGPLSGNLRAGSMLFTFLGPGVPMVCLPEFWDLGLGWLRDGFGPLPLDAWAVPRWFAFPSGEQHAQGLRDTV